MKNLKKGLAVALALTMVSTVVPTNVFAYTAPTAGDITTAVAAENFLSQLNDYLAANGIDYTGIQVNGEYVLDTASAEELLTFDGTAATITDGLKAAAVKALTFFGYKTEEYVELYYLTQVASKVEAMAVTQTSGTLYTIANGVITAGTDSSSLIGKVAKAIDDIETAGKSATKTNYEELNTALNAVIKVEEFEGALPTEKAEGNFDMYAQADYVAIKELAQEMVDEYFGNTYDSNLKDYIKGLKDGYKAYFDGATKRTSKQVAAEIKKLTSTAEYKRYEGEDAVDSIIDDYNEMLDAAKEVEKVINAKYEATVALMKTQAKYDGETKETLSSYIADYDAKDVIKLINSDTFEIIKDYKEEVLDMILDLDTEKVGKTYFEATTETVFAPELTVIKLIGYLAAADSDDLGLLDIADDTTGERYYDLIAERMTEVQDALKAVTTSIKGISVNNLSSANIGKVNDAYKAIKNLEDVKKYKNNLTSDEADTVADQKEFVEMLRTYALLNGIVSGTTTGWVDLGNGNWDYYLENGDAPTKWVAAGTNWYFVQNGHMLRNSWVAKDAAGAVWYWVDNAGKMVSNTTVGGYVINANGEWHK